MKIRLFIICSIISLVCFSGCSKSENVRTEQKEEKTEEKQGQKTEKAESIFENEVRFYMMEADKDTTVTPGIEIDGTNGTFMFLHNVLLSANVQGTFEIQDNILAAKTDDGAEQYLFEITGEDSLRFVQDGSSKIVLSDAEDNEKFLADKAEFKIVENRMPSKEEVFAMRRKALEGMTEEAKEKLTNNIRAANESLERSCLYDNLFERLSDPEDLSWNLLEKTGEVQIGWAFEEGVEYDRSSEMTYEQFAEKYGEPVVMENPYDADALIGIVQGMKDSLKSNLLRGDLENLIQNINSARETHDVEYVKQIYYAVHDMDYFLLRYGIEDVGEHISDMSAVSTYYGVLEVYQ